MTLSAGNAPWRHCLQTLDAIGRLRIAMVCAVVLGAVGIKAGWAADPLDSPSASSETKSLILPGESFLVEDRPAFILWPEKSLRTEAAQPWVFYAPTLPAYPDQHEKWMHQQFLDAGIAVAGIDVGEAYGSAASRKLFDAFYQQMVEKRNFSKKPCLLGRSRGGLWVTSWACDHPERFAGLAGIYPVFDFRTYPGIDKTAAAYGMSVPDLSQQIDHHNPISRVSALATVKLPTLIIHGDQDTVVPLKENSARFAEIYRNAGAEDHVELIVAAGQGHSFWQGFFRCQPLVDFVIARAKQGAAE
ncbi:MAG: alpha/beta hydrolase family protein [Planctomycetaceae bacterium]